MTDPIMHWISCYEKLILKFDDMELQIKDEFSNFIWFIKLVLQHMSFKNL